MALSVFTSPNGNMAHDPVMQTNTFATVTGIVTDGVRKTTVKKILVGMNGTALGTATFGKLTIYDGPAGVNASATALGSWSFAIASSAASGTVHFNTPIEINPFLTYAFVSGLSFGYASGSNTVSANVSLYYE